MTKPYLIALDLDGTLLRSDLTIGNKTKETLANLHAQGHAIVIATGRILKLAQTIPAQLGFGCHLVACNGGIVMAENQEIIVRNIFESQRFEALSAQLKAAGIYYHYYTEDTIYASEFLHTAKKFYDMAQTYPPESRLEVLIIDQEATPVLTVEGASGKAMDKNVYKFGIYRDGTYDFDQVRASLDGVTGLETMFSAPNLLDIMLTGVSKWSGIDALAQKLGIPTERVMVFGDNENDADMLTHAGIGVVMGNAAPEIKAIGSHVTESNDEEGIHTFLTAYFSEEATS